MTIDRKAEADADAAPRLHNQHVQTLALTLTKAADGLVDPKLVLSWLMGAVGAPVALAGAVVPVREAGALLPQLALARHVRAAPRRGPLWAAGAAVQGVAALGIGASALLLDGVAAGVGMLLCLALLSLARALCSVSHKDALARTVEKTARGAVTGTASSVAAAVVLAVAAGLALGILPLETWLVAGLVLFSAGLFLAGAGAFTLLDEPRDVPEDRQPGYSLAEMLVPLRADRQLRRFVIARALLTPTAFALPFLMLLSGADAEAGLGALGPLMLASALASVASAWVWGRLSDRSSRLTLAMGGLVAAGALIAAALAGAIFGGLGRPLGAAALVFLAQTAHEGVRQGRKIHLTDMASDETRALYTALSNSLIGVVLALGAGFGLVAGALGVPATLGIFALSCAAGAATALGLDEVQRG